MGTATEEQVMCYRATCEHGKIRALAVDRPHLVKDNAKDIASWIRAGLTIDRVTVEVARQSDLDCEPCDEKWKKKRQKKNY